MGGQGSLRIDTRVEQVAGDDQHPRSGGRLDGGRQLTGGGQLPGGGVFPKMQVGDDDDPTTHRDVYGQQVGDLTRGSQRDQQPYHHHTRCGCRDAALFEAGT